MHLIIIRQDLILTNIIIIVFDLSEENSIDIDFIHSIKEKLIPEKHQME